MPFLCLGYGIEQNTENNVPMSLFPYGSFKVDSIASKYNLLPHLHTCQ